jgi:hypothetical protein
MFETAVPDVLAVAAMFRREIAEHWRLRAEVQRRVDRFRNCIL